MRTAQPGPRPTSPPRQRCCSAWTAPNTISPAVRAGVAHCLTLSCRWAVAGSSLAPRRGSVAPPALASRCWFSLSPRNRSKRSFRPRRPVTANLTALTPATPGRFRMRDQPDPPTCQRRQPAPPEVHFAHPEADNVSRSFGSLAPDAAPLSPVAPVREPRNQAARPRSCRDRTTVFRSDIGSAFGDDVNGITTPSSGVLARLPLPVTSEAHRQEDPSPKHARHRPSGRRTGVHEHQHSSE